MRLPGHVEPRIARNAALLVASSLVFGCSSQDMGPTALSSAEERLDLTVNKPEFNIAATAGEELTFAIASDGSNVLVGYTYNEIARARLVSSTGQIIATVNTERSSLNGGIG